MFAHIIKTWKRALWLLVQMSRTLQNALWDVYETLHFCTFADLSLGPHEMYVFQTSPSIALVDFSL